MSKNIIQNKEYKNWLKELKNKVRSAQIRAAVKVNTELLKFYWELGSEIVEKQKLSSWGDGFLKQLSKDLIAEFPEMKGFSRRNLERIKKWYLFWNQQDIITTQVVSQLKNKKSQQLVGQLEDEKNQKVKQLVSQLEDKKSPQLVDELKYLSIFEIPWGII